MLHELDVLVGTAIEAKTFPSIEIVVAKDASTLAHGVWGSSTTNSRPLKFNAIFDVASITKPVATATLLRQLVRENVVSLSDKVTRFLPDFHGASKDNITLGQLAFHVSGLPADMPLSKMTADPEVARKLLKDAALKYEPGSKMVYSCLGYILLGEMIEQSLAMPLDQAFHKFVASPLGLFDTQFCPLNHKVALARVVPTLNEANFDNPPAGVVHDSTARLLGGSSGNAGLFSTASDLLKYARFLLEEQDPHAFRNGNSTKLDARTVGWDFKSAYDVDCSSGRKFPVNSIGHTGFTGTSLWIDPASKLIVIALSNRTYFSHRENLAAMKAFRSQLHDLAANAALDIV